MRQIQITAYKMPNGDYSLWRSLTTIDFSKQKREGNIKEYYTVVAKQATFHVGFENVDGSPEDAKRIARHIWRQLRGEPNKPEQFIARQFVKQHELPFVILNTVSED